MKNLVLIGMMGAGKSSAGKVLAKKLHWRFVDSDKVIEKITKMTIPEIFEKKGEQAFRKIEKRVIQKLCQKKETVIAVGGGAPCFQENWNSFRKNGFVIYLSASAKTLYRRLKKDPATSQRPVIDGKAVLSKIRALLRERERFYKKADCVVRTDFLTKLQTTEKLWEILKNNLSQKL